MKLIKGCFATLISIIIFATILLTISVETLRITFLTPTIINSTIESIDIATLFEDFLSPILKQQISQNMDLPIPPELAEGLIDDLPNIITEEDEETFKYFITENVINFYDFVDGKTEDIIIEIPHERLMEILESKLNSPETLKNIIPENICDPETKECIGQEDVMRMISAFTGTDKGQEIDLTEVISSAFGGGSEIGFQIPDEIVVDTSNLPEELLMVRHYLGYVRAYELVAIFIVALLFAILFIMYKYKSLAIIGWIGLISGLLFLSGKLSSLINPYQLISYANIELIEGYQLSDFDFAVNIATAFINSFTNIFFKYGLILSIAGIVLIALTVIITKSKEKKTKVTSNEAKEKMEVGKSVEEDLKKLEEGREENEAQ